MSLLSIAGTTFAIILLNRLNEYFDRTCLLPRQVQEKCKEQHVHLFMTFVGIIKASDTVSHDGLLNNNGKLGCPAKFIAVSGVVFP